ncbi:MAG: hypothetical protein KDD89_11430 [Anaerolineales bacterium]|nr:hypothetical protein [Anaerolineales bacterium]
MYTLFATLENNRITPVKQRQVEAVKHGDVIKLDDGQLARIVERGDGRQELWFDAEELLIAQARRDAEKTAADWFQSITTFCNSLAHDVGLDPWEADEADVWDTGDSFSAYSGDVEAYRGLHW